MTALTPHVAEMIDRYEALQELKLKVEREITAVHNGLLVAGCKPGRPRLVPTHTEVEERQAHAAHQRGESSEWIDAGERQYQRNRKRDARARRYVA